jgi:hypothetical protein
MSQGFHRCPLPEVLDSDSGSQAQELEVCPASLLMTCEQAAWRHRPCFDEAFAVKRGGWCLVPGLPGNIVSVGGASD